MTILSGSLTLHTQRSKKEVQRTVITVIFIVFSLVWRLRLRFFLFLYIEELNCYLLTYLQMLGAHTHSVYRPTAGSHDASVIRTAAGVRVMSQTEVVTHLMS